MTYRDLRSISDLRSDVQALQRELDYAERRLHTIQNEFLSLMRMSVRLSGNEDLESLINMMWDAYRLTQMLLAALAALHAARMMGGDPIAWLQFIGSAGALGMTIWQEMEVRRPRY